MKSHGMCEFTYLCPWRTAGTPGRTVGTPREDCGHPWEDCGHPQGGLWAPQGGLWVPQGQASVAFILLSLRPSHSLAQRIGPWTPCPGRLKAALSDNFQSPRVGGKLCVYAVEAAYTTVFPSLLGTQG